MLNYLLALLSFFLLSQNLNASQDLKTHVLVVGGAGYIGSHVNEMLHEQGYETVVLDNLSQGNRRAVEKGVFIEGDISDAALLDHIFQTYPIEVVMHFAAFKNVGESVSNPLKYYNNNVSATVTLLEGMLRNHVNLFIFSSSAAIFGMPQEDLVTETHPCQPINPYGQSKLMVEKILEDLGQVGNGFKYCALRYFNAAGGDPRGKLKSYQTKESNLIPVVLKSLLHPEGSVTIFGTDYPTQDGTCIRDYIHIEDLGSAHILAMEKLLAGAQSSCYNLGNGRGFSVRQVIDMAEKVTGMQVNVVEGERRAGDPPYLIASSAKAKQELNWHPNHGSLEEIVRDTWNALQK
ncbi:UDP-glucose 4-epimerase [Parachlamydia acanthamoebae UV-7]|uniref:UDP-glucose 4-epimerase n=1 Tax=Parachlamydia acanthamoebae (strain UV7) TaxID=765952 RepID=F8KWS5_PARAV|nr:UDP-glucose 4-epimerase GalE [Parachlamydia acanthamoebae]EFB41881.1 hypothetical protein pah_c022o185 [Parachlamydia acanthamoebae str. Hall's coccus]CCB86239.1 UDP-glucose 4-epimerase [Parachlamydia acanthamoebae UV-7]